jgi:hypothetical protein
MSSEVTRIPNGNVYSARAGQGGAMSQDKPDSKTNLILGGFLVHIKFGPTCGAIGGSYCSSRDVVLYCI